MTHAVLRGLINKHDPIGLIESGAPEDEYEPEVDRLIPRLTRAKTVADVQREIHIVFNQMFGGQAGTPDYFAALASDVWSQLINESPRSAEA